MTKNLKLSALAVFLLLVVVVTMFAVNAERSGNDSPTAKQTTSGAPIVRENSHRLSTSADGKVTFVEFLDFECEACRAAFPAVEQLREEYAGRVTFVVRYFPIPSHFNAERAARAVESAAQQGKFEAMYRKMYETQSEWGEQQKPADATFRGFAQELGLDLTRFDHAYNAASTLARIKADVADGTELGVQGTPTFFLNGSRLNPKSVGDLKEAIDAALGN